MVDVNQPNRSSDQTTAQPLSGSLNRWLLRVVEVPQLQVSSRLRGNSLYLLFESQCCPDATIVPRLQQALTTTSISDLLPPGTPAIYRVAVYGRILRHTRPEWSQSFYLNPSSQRAAGRSSTGVTPSSTKPVSTLDLARQGQPDAIAHYLSDQVGQFGVAVRVRKKVRREAKAGEQKPQAQLLVACECMYTPDPVLVAETIAQKLRELSLKGFSEAILIGQVRGEAKPEWRLRVDLTPPETLLREWSRWGDVQALSRWLNQHLRKQALQVSVVLKDATLHLSSKSTTATPPEQSATVAAIARILNAIAPQGIHAAAIYAIEHEAGDPLWVHWLTLPAATQSDRAPSTLDLAQQGSLGAIAFLLTRRLNSDLDAVLKTGGVRVQVRQKDDLLHIMTEALSCPMQAQVGPTIARCLKPLQIVHVAGVRVYGRRAGQKQPLWSYGIDFAPRQRLVPEATPEFAASDAYVEDLLAPPGALVPMSQIAAERASAITQVVESAVQRVQRSLIRTQLWIPLETATSEPVAIANPANQRSGLVALVWGAVGVLLVVQADWLLGRWLQPAPIASVAVQSSPTPSPVPSLASPAASPTGLPRLNLSKSKPRDPSAFNSPGFTRSKLPQPNSAMPAPSSFTRSAPIAFNARGVDNASAALQASTSLPASPPQPKAIVPSGPDAYPSFNSRQLDEKIALYRQYVAENGAPDVLVIGSSRALRGVDPIALTEALTEQGYSGVKVFNFGVNGATAQVVDLIVRQMLPQETLPKLILWADGARAFNSGRVDTTYNGMVASEGYKTFASGKPPIVGTLAAQTPAAKSAEAAPLNAYQAFNQQLDGWLGRWSLAHMERDRLVTRLRDQLASHLPVGLLTAIANGTSTLGDATSPGAAASTPGVLADGPGMVDVNGFLPLPNRFNPATYYQKYARVSGDYDSDYDAFSLNGAQTTALLSLSQFAQSRHIPLVFVNLPLTKDYLDPTRKRYEEQFQQYMLQVAPQFGFSYRDLSSALAPSAYFSDPSHLNRYGGYEVSRRLAQDVMIPWNRARQ